MRITTRGGDWRRRLLLMKCYARTQQKYVYCRLARKLATHTFAPSPDKCCVLVVVALYVSSIGHIVRCRRQPLQHPQTTLTTATTTLFYGGLLSCQYDCAQESFFIAFILRVSMCRRFFCVTSCFVGNRTGLMGVKKHETTCDDGSI